MELTCRFSRCRRALGLGLVVMLGSSPDLLAAQSQNQTPIEKLHLVSFEDPPYVFESNKDEPGLVVRYVQELMKRAEVPFSLSIMPPKRAMLYTFANKNTCVFPIERSQEREVKLSWVSPISISRHGFYSNPTKLRSPIRVLNDVSGLRIGSYFGSAMGEYLTSWGFNVDAAADNNANVTKLKADRIDLWAADTLTASYLASQQNFPLGEAELVFFTTLRAVGCHPDISKDTIALLNRKLQEMYQDGTIDRITERFEKTIK